MLSFLALPCLALCSTFGVAQDAAACLGWGALHDRTMVFLAFPDYGQNLCKVHITTQWVEAIRAAMKTVHSADTLHNDLDLRNFVGNNSNSVKLIDFACCALSGFSRDTMARQEKQFMAALMLQVSSANYNPQSVSTSLALSVFRLVCCYSTSMPCCCTVVSYC